MTIGQKLSEKRREMGKSIKDVEKVLKVRSAYLEALENDQFEKLPSITYCRAFLTDYASYLGLDKDEILEEFDSLYATPLSETKTIAPRLVLPEWLGLALVMLLIVSLFSLGLYYLFFYTQKTKPPGEQLPVQKETTLPVEEPVAEPEPVIKPTTTPLPEPKKEVAVKIRITGTASWIRVVINGEKVYEGMMRQGDVKSWKGEEIKVRVGNASSTEVLVDGKPVELGRTSSGVVEKTFRGDTGD